MKYSWLKSLFFLPLLVVWTSWVASEAFRQLANRACWQQKHRQLGFFFFFVWTRAMQLFPALMGNHHHGFLFIFTNPLICGRRGGDKGREQREHKRNGLWPEDELSLSALLSLSRPISLFPRMPGMPPVFPCSNYCLRKLCQRAEIVLMRGPAAFASVIWWISLGTHKTRHTRGYVATSEPRGRWRLLLAPSCWPGGSHIILVRRRLKSIQLGWAGALCQGNLRGLNLSCIMPGLDSSTCVQDLHVLCSLQACLL